MNADDILKGRFVKRVFQETAISIDKAVSSTMSKRGFQSPEWEHRSFQTSDSALTYQHPIQNRFVDMRTRNNEKTGRKRKKHHPVHNRIIFGHYSQVIKELSFGFTEAVREELRTIEEKNI